MLFLLGLTLRTTISCGAIDDGTNAYILGKHVLEVEKCPVFWWQSDLMNRLIHRSWGEGFVNIFLDLSIHISHFSSSTFVCGLRSVNRYSRETCGKSETGETGEEVLSAEF